MTAWRSPAISTCRRAPVRFRRWSRCMAAAGRRARAARFSIGDKYLAERGYVLFSVSYRLAKKGHKTFPQAVQDVLAAIQFVRGSAGEFKVDPERIGLFGASAGGHLASLAALERRYLHGRLSAGQARRRQHQGQGAGRRLRGLRPQGDVAPLRDAEPAREQHREFPRCARRWKIRGSISMPRRSTMRPSPTTRSACFSASAPRTISSTAPSRPTPSCWR